MSAQFARTPHRGNYTGGGSNEPHAALLIDFDNVTMGIRSDLTKELKNLLNSAIIKGKVAVQRAYADWRRYPQYIVPLAESSVDLIFAPAYGSAKKNATDIRLAIDAMELVFTRPEIGTIILLSGDSDFSSLVLKLKEYGKYVIGVGIRESASDLLVQNCDEYYSYSALTGLTRAGEELPPASDDPWELTELAMKQMVDNNDVMRSDRLKQVLLELDPGFDEKALGFQKFNKFLQEAATRGLLSLRKQENGQYEVGPPGSEGDPIETLERESRPRSRSRRGGRGRYDREREERHARNAEAVTADAEPVDTGASDDNAPVAAADAPEAPHAQVAEPVAAQTPEAVIEPVDAASAAQTVQEPVEEPVEEPIVAERPRLSDGSRGRGRGRGRDRNGSSQQTGEQAGEPVAGESASAEPAPAKAIDLKSSYTLLQRAVQDLVRRVGGAARDSDIKRRMLELQAGWDESSLGFSKFSRFLRQAHDADIVTLNKTESGNFDVMPGNTGDQPFPRAARVESPNAPLETAAQDKGHDPVEPGDEQPTAQQEEERDRGRNRGRGRGRDRERTPYKPPAPLVGATQATEPAGAERLAPVAARPAVEQEGSATTQATTPSHAAPATEAPASSAAPAQAAMGFRRGSTRGRGGMASGPPPFLEGQTAGPARPTVTSTPPAPVPPAAAKPAHVQTDAFATPASADIPAGVTSQESSTPKQPAKAAKKAVAKPERFNAAGLGMPKGAGEIASYMVGTYKGVGPKSVQTLIEKIGAARVFETLDTNPERVRETIGNARADILIDAFQRDLKARRRNAAPKVEMGSPEKAPAKAAPSKAAAKTPAEAPVKAAAKSPAKAPSRTPAKTPAKTAAKTPARTARPAKAVVAAVVEAETATPAKKSSRGRRGGKRARRGTPEAK